MTLDIWFWQRMITPHMTGLAVALARRGHRVTYVAEEEMSAERISLGWKVPRLEGVSLARANSRECISRLAQGAPPGSIHLTQGLRSNGLIRDAQRVIEQRKLLHYPIFETLDLRGIGGLVKPMVYAFHLWRRRKGITGILAIGYETVDWIKKIDKSQASVYPFAYFLAQGEYMERERSDNFNIIFVGSFVKGKNVSNIIEAINIINDKKILLSLVGGGPLHDNLHALAERLLAEQVEFLGIVGMPEIPEILAKADCLVLPSSHDGWGAVISEALLVGTPVICSAACGAAGVVKASGAGGVFPVGDVTELANLLKKEKQKWPVDPADREKLRQWSRCIGADSGAEYLEKIVLQRSDRDLPEAPWSAPPQTALKIP